MKINLFFSFSDIFSLFSSESGSYVVREEMERMLHVVDGKVPDTLRKCFSEVHLKIYILFLCVDEVLTLCDKCCYMDAYIQSVIGIFLFNDCFAFLISNLSCAEIQFSSWSLLIWS